MFQSDLGKSTGCSIPGVSKAEPARKHGNAPFSTIHRSELLVAPSDFLVVLTAFSAQYNTIFSYLSHLVQRKRLKSCGL